MKMKKLKDQLAQIEQENARLREENSKVEAFKRSISEVQRRSQEQIEVANKQIQLLQNDVQFWKSTAEQLQQQQFGSPREDQQPQQEQEQEQQEESGQKLQHPNLARAKIQPPGRRAATSYRNRPGTISEGVPSERMAQISDGPSEISSAPPTPSPRAIMGIGGPMADMAKITAAGIQVARSKSVTRRVERGEILPGPLCGLDIDLKKKIEKKLDEEVAEDVRDWVLALVNEDIGDDFYKSLRSGVILCKIVNSIVPGSIKSIRVGTLPFHMMENINSFIQACTTVFGMPTTDVFQTVDLYEGKNMTAVVSNLHALGRLCSKLPGYSGPSIGLARKQSV